MLLRKSVCVLALCRSVGNSSRFHISTTLTCFLSACFAFQLLACLIFVIVIFFRYNLLGNLGLIIPLIMFGICYSWVNVCRIPLFIVVIFILVWRSFVILVWKSFNGFRRIIMKSCWYHRWFGIWFKCFMVIDTSFFRLFVLCTSLRDHLLGENRHVIVTPLRICHSGGIESSGRILGDSTGFLFFTNCNFPLSWRLVSSAVAFQAT